MLRLMYAFLSVLLVVACATSPLGRTQLRFIPEDQMQQMGVAAYQELRQELPEADDPGLNNYVTCVARSITEQIGADGTEWEVTVFQRDQANAFALPGGKIGVFSGLLDIADTPDQLAAVIAHEVAHVIAQHSNERVSTQYATQAGLDLLQVIAGGSGGADRQQLFSLLGLGAQVGIILPFSRKHETEADLIGLDLMARAGFDPRASIELWQDMLKEGGDAPPEFLSTHPAGETRIAELRERMPRALELYEQARAQGERPSCR